MPNKLTLMSAVGFWILAPVAADALPLLGPRPLAASAAIIENVKVICDEEGRCFRPPTRRPVARWVYGDNNFYGPYAGPAYYGNPRYRYKWYPFWW
jgi:hypothetical protein